MDSLDNDIILIVFWDNNSVSICRNYRAAEVLEEVTFEQMIELVKFVQERIFGYSIIAQTYGFGGIYVYLDEKTFYEDQDLHATNGRIFFKRNYPSTGIRVEIKRALVAPF